MKRFFYLITMLSILTYREAKAQSIPNYTFNATTSTFTPIAGTSGSTEVGAIEDDDAGSGSSIPIGFSFVFDGTSYTSCYPSSNGFISFSGSCSCGGNSIGSTSSPAPLIAPLWGDLGGQPSRNSSTYYSPATYKTTGTSPNRVFTMEWLHFGWTWNKGDVISFQVKLYEGSNKIQLLYRQEAESPGSNTASIGIVASSGYLSLQSVSSPSVSSTTPVNNISTRPASNTMYEFTPCFPPAIATGGQPAATTNICAGSNTSLSVNATGTSIGYQWQVNTGSGYSNITNGGVYSGATSSTLNITAAPASMNGYLYKAIIIGLCGSNVTSTAATLNVKTLPNITSQPVNSTICSGANATFSVNAGTTSSPTYQWQVNSGSGYTNITDAGVYSGSTTSTLTLTAPPSTYNNYTYRCIVSGACTPAVTSTPASLIFNIQGLASSPTNMRTCPNGNAFFSLGVTGVNLTYQWQVNTSGSTYSNITNGGIYAGANTGTLTITGATAAMDGYRYRAILSGSCLSAVASSPATLNVTVPASAISNVRPLTFCPGDSVALSVANNPGFNFGYQWQLNGTNINAANANTYTALQQGSYTVTAQDAFNCSYTSPATTVSFYPVPVPVTTPTGNVGICAGDSLNIFGNTGTSLTYQWVRNNVPISGGNTANLNVNTPGTYQLIESNAYCTVTSPAIVIATNSRPTATINANKYYFCTGDSAQLTANTASGYTYQWMKNGSVITGATNATYMAYTAGTYSVTVKNGSCPNTSGTLPLVQQPLPTDSSISTFTGHNAICNGDVLVLQVPVYTNYHYQWYYNGNYIAGSNSASYAATNAGSYRARISNSYGCAIFSQAINTINNPVVAPVIASTGVSLCTGTFSSYQWYFDQSSIPTATQRCYTGTTTGSYTVTVTDASGCQGTSAPYKLTIVGISNVNNAQNDVQIYPNPSTGIVHIAAPYKTNISIMSLDGKMIYHAEQTNDLNLTMLANGVYVIRVYNSNNELIKTDKLIKAAN